jgi:threonine aldolase
VVTPETNIVIFSAPDGFVEAMARHAVELSDTPDGRVRAVTHLDVSADDVQAALETARQVLA